MRSHLKFEANKRISVIISLDRYKDIIIQWKKIISVKNGLFPIKSLSVEIVACWSWDTELRVRMMFIILNRSIYVRHNIVNRKIENRE